MSRPASAACHSSSALYLYLSLSLSLCLYLLLRPRFPTRLRHPTPVTRPPDHPTTRPTVHPSTPLLSLPPTSPALFHLPTNPTSNASHHRSVICGLSNSLRGLLLPETLLPSLSLSLSLGPFLALSPSLSIGRTFLFLCRSRFSHRSIISPSSSIYLSIYLSLYPMLRGRLRLSTSSLNSS